jgi:hypothetical protein
VVPLIPLVILRKKDKWLYDNTNGYIIIVHRGIRTPYKTVLVYNLYSEIGSYRVLYNTSYYCLWPFFDGGLQNNYIVFAQSRSGKYFYKLYDIKTGKFSWILVLPPGDPCLHEKVQSSPLLHHQKALISCQRGTRKETTVYDMVFIPEKRIAQLSNGISLNSQSKSPTYFTNSNDLVQFETKRSLIFWSSKNNYKSLRVSMNDIHPEADHSFKWCERNQIFIFVHFTNPTTSLKGFRIFAPPQNGLIKRKQQFFSVVKIDFKYEIPRSHDNYFKPGVNGTLVHIRRSIDKDSGLESWIGAKVLASKAYF